MSDTTQSSLGGASVVGLAFAPFAFLFSFWIPTLALLFALVTVVAGALDLRGSTGRHRRIALLTLGLGVTAIALIVIVVVATTESSSGNAVNSIAASG